MQREIKFKAWNETLNKMVYDLDVGNSSADKDGYSYEEDIMQYSGLKDSDDNDIYEGDILSGNKGISDKWLVIFEQGKFQMKFIGATHLTIQNRDINQDFSILGNEFENPELLQK